MKTKYLNMFLNRQRKWKKREKNMLFFFFTLDLVYETNMNKNFFKLNLFVQQLIFVHVMKTTESAGNCQ